MGAFFKHVLDEFLSSAFLEEVSAKFHFGKAHQMELRSVAEEMLPLMYQEAFWERGAYKKLYKKPLTVSDSRGGRKERFRIKEVDGCSGTEWECVVMSLGKGIDRLQESYSEKELIMQSYMTQALSGEVLMRGYKACARYLKKETGRYVAAYHFPGSEEGFPQEMLPDLLKTYAPGISCNSAFCMFPTKSVVFIAELTQDESKRCKSICAGCTSAMSGRRSEFCAACVRSG